MTDSGRLTTQIEYDSIIEKQVLISYLSKGITFTDTDNLSPYDRDLIYDTIMKLREKEAEALKSNKH